MTILRRVQGDTNDTAVLTLGGIVSIPAAATLVATISRPGHASVNVDAEVLSAADRTVLVKFGGWLTYAIPGVWNLVVRPTGTWGDGQTGRRTFPSRTVTLVVTTVGPSVTAP